MIRSIEAPPKDKNDLQRGALNAVGLAFSLSKFRAWNFCGVGRRDFAGCANELYYVYTVLPLAIWTHFTHRVF